MSFLADEPFTNETQTWPELRLENTENGTTAQSQLTPSRRLLRQPWKDLEFHVQPFQTPGATVTELLPQPWKNLEFPEGQRARWGAAQWSLWSFGSLQMTAMGVITKGLWDAQIDEIAPSFLWRQSEPIHQFLEIHRHLLPVLREVAYYVRHIFGQDAVIELDLMTDHEGMEIPTLFAYIVTTISLEQAFQLLDRLDELWYLSLPEDILKIFNVNLCIR